jgi:rSAM/selenodomain-associated transferase 2
MNANGAAGRGGCHLSVIVPCLEEGAIVVSRLTALQPLRASGHELILVDGGSCDGTAALAEPWVDRLLQTSPGRARQMNQGAAAATGDVLWFLHLDTLLYPGADGDLLAAIGSGQVWGRFDVRLSGQARVFRVIETLMNARSHLTGIATGDQGIFVSRTLFEGVGGYPDIPLMEDIALSRRLKGHRRPIRIRRRLETSSRRWEARGVWRTVGLMWWLRLAYALGASPGWLARRYGQCSSPRHAC